MCLQRRCDFFIDTYPIRVLTRQHPASIVYWCTQRGGWELRAVGREEKKPQTDCNSKSNLTQRSRTHKKTTCHSNGTTGPKPREENFDGRAEQNAKPPLCVSLAHLWSFHFILKLTTTSSSARPENCPHATIRCGPRSKLTCRSWDRYPSTLEIKASYWREKQPREESFCSKHELI